MSNKKGKSSSVECSNCGGPLTIDCLQDFVKCSYCGTNHNASDLLNESDVLSIEKIKAKVYRDIETRKQQAEYERLKYEMDKEEKRITAENITAFRKSKFSKVLIVFIIVAVLRSAACFNNERILAGILSIITVGLLGMSYLMGMQVIREKRPNLRVLPAILAFIIFVPFFNLYSPYDSNLSTAEEFEWSDMELCYVLPEPSSNVGEIHIDTEKELSIDILKMSRKEYNDYIDECKNNGFTVDSDLSSFSYEAYNESSYHLDLYYYESWGELSIRLEAPMEMTEIQWPNSKMAKMIPAPKSTIGNISWERSAGFMIYVGNTSISDYQQYVNDCSAKGFNVDYNKGTKYYYAYNKKGYYLSLEYEGNNIMSVELDSPS